MRKHKHMLGEDLRTWRIIHGTTYRYSQLLTKMQGTGSGTGADPGLLSVCASYLAACWVGPGASWPSLRECGGCQVTQGDAVVDVLIGRGVKIGDVMECALGLFAAAVDALPSTEDEVRETVDFTEAPALSMPG
jgi:hypothetical protein